VSAAVAIGWRGLSPTTQDRLVRDAWLLMAWWIVGLACSWLLLEVFRLRSPALRYPLTALVAVIGVAIEIAVYFESGSTLFWLTLITVAATAAIMAGVVWLVSLHRLMSDSGSVILANLAHDFVFDRATERGILPHRPQSESVPTILRETLGRGVTFLVFSAIGGVTLRLMLPGAASLADIFG